MRFLSIDVLRGLAILLMIQVHFVGNLSPRPEDDPWLYDVSSLLGILPAPLFTLLSGVSYGLWLRKQESLKRRDEDITKVTLRRGLFLFGLGIAFNVFVWLPEDTFDWDVLTLIGSALILLAFARKLPSGVLVLLCVMILLLSPLFCVATDYSEYWKASELWKTLEYDADFNLTDVVFGFLANGYFPVFPWIIFPLVGFILGDAIYGSPKLSAPFPRGIMATGIALVCISLIAGLTQARLPAPIRKHFLTGFTIYPASTEYLLGMVGLTMISMVLLHRWIDGRADLAAKSRWLKFLVVYSAYSLTVYVLHHMVHLWPLWVVGTCMHDIPLFYWQKAMPAALALALALFFVVVCYVFLRFLEKRKNHGLEGLMRWFCD